MINIDIKPLLKRFDEYLAQTATAKEAVGAKKEFGELIRCIFTTFDSKKATKQELTHMKAKQDSFIKILETIQAPQREDLCVICALAYGGRASVEHALGNIQEAEKDFRQSADCAAGSPDGAEIRIAGVLNLASMYSKANMLDKSAACYNEAEVILRRNPTLDGINRRIMSVKSDRGGVYCRQGLIEQACEVLGDAIALYDALDEPEQGMDRVLIKCLANRCGINVNLRKFEQARQEGLRALEIEGENYSSTTPILLTNLAAACKALGYFDEANDYYTKVIMIKKVTGVINTPAGRLDLATLLLGRGETRLLLKFADQAKADLSEAISIFLSIQKGMEKAVNPRLAIAYNKRSQAYRLLELEDKAQEDLRLAANLTGKALD